MADTTLDGAVADRALAGAALSHADLVTLDTADVLSLGMLADGVRRRCVGSEVSYVRVWDFTAALATVPEAATEVRLGPLGATLPDTLATVQAARAAAGRRVLTGFSLADLAVRADAGWGVLIEILTALKAAGLDAVAEAPLDLLDDATLMTAYAAALPLRAITVQKPVASRIDLFLRLRALAPSLGGIAVFAPLPREQSVAAPTTGYEDVRGVAMARLALPEVPVIEVDWQQYGPKLAQVALTFGANHLDRVSAVDDEGLGRRRGSAEDVQRQIIAAGFTPVERAPRG